MNITTTHTLTFNMTAVNGDHKIACDFLTRAAKTADLALNVCVQPAPEGQTNETRSIVEVRGNDHADLEVFFNSVQSAMHAIGVVVA